MESSQRTLFSKSVNYKLTLLYSPLLQTHNSPQKTYRPSIPNQCSKVQTTSSPLNCESKSFQLTQDLWRPSQCSRLCTSIALVNTLHCKHQSFRSILLHWRLQILQVTANHSFWNEITKTNCETYLSWKMILCTMFSLSFVVVFCCCCLNIQISSRLFSPTGFSRFPLFYAESIFLKTWCWISKEKQNSKLCLSDLADPVQSMLMTYFFCLLSNL